MKRERERGVQKGGRDQEREKGRKGGNQKRGEKEKGLRGKGKERIKKRESRTNRTKSWFGICCKCLNIFNWFHPVNLDYHKKSPLFPFPFTSLTLYRQQSALGTKLGTAVVCALLTSNLGDLVELNSAENGSGSASRPFLNLLFPFLSESPPSCPHFPIP